MGLDIYFREDLENTVKSLEMAALYQERTDFRSGWMAALAAVRAAFGLEITGNTAFGEIGKMLTVEAREVEA